jgi:glutamate racemase
MSDELLDVARGYLAPILEAGCDTLILGCTHYPLLTGVISYVAGDGVTLVSSAEETAKDVYRVLHDSRLARAEGSPEPRHRFLATGDPAPFAALGHRFLGPEIGLVESAPVGITFPA